MALVESCLSELRKCPHLLDSADLTVAQATLPGLDQKLQRSIEHEWHKVSHHTRAMASSLSLPIIFKQKPGRPRVQQDFFFENNKNKLMGAMCVLLVERLEDVAGSAGSVAQLLGL